MGCDGMPATSIERRWSGVYWSRGTVGSPSVLIDDAETKGKGWGWTGLGPAKHETGEPREVRSRRCYWLSIRGFFQMCSASAHSLLHHCVSSDRF
jgi:hypothetical protein